MKIQKYHIVKMIVFSLIVLWTYAAASKVMDFEQARTQMLNQVFPRSISPTLAWLVPAIELLTALLLVSQKTRQIGLYFSALLMSAFTTYIAIVLTGVFGRVPCSCGGILKGLSYPTHLAFNTVFLLLTLLGILLSKERRAMGKVL